MSIRTYRVKSRFISGRVYNVLRVRIGDHVRSWRCDCPHFFYRAQFHPRAAHTCRHIRIVKRRLLQQQAAK